jgi:hypothetical protein
MKTTRILFLVFAAMVFFSSVLSAADLKPEPIRVQVEGEDEAKVVTVQAADVSGQAKDSPVIIFKRAGKSKSAAAIKDLAAKSDLENEVMDSLIAKISDMESEINTQRNYNIAALSAFILLFAALFFIKRKK